jgi:hypothetical protein
MRLFIVLASPAHISLSLGRPEISVEDANNAIERRTFLSCNWLWLNCVCLAHSPAASLMYTCWVGLFAAGASRSAPCFIWPINKLANKVVLGEWESERRRILPQCYHLCTFPGIVTLHSGYQFHYTIFPLSGTWIDIRSQPCLTNACRGSIVNWKIQVFLNEAVFLPLLAIHW